MDLIMFFTVVGLFFALIAIKRLAKLEFCVICASVSLTWITFLALYWLGYKSDPLLIGILMGGSAVGMFYLVEKRTKESLQVFRLPFLLTLMLGAYLLAGKTGPEPGTGILMVSLWVLFGIFYAFRNHKSFNRMVKSIIACCSNW